MARTLSLFSDMIIPCLIVLVLLYGLRKKCNVYDMFIKGAEDGFKTVIHIMPALTGLMIAVGVLRASGFLTVIGDTAGTVTERIGLHAELIPLILAKMFSSSAASGLVLDIFRTYGPDSRIGMTASILMSCTETIFYTMSIYFMAAGIKKTRYTLPGALLATAAGIAASIWLGN